MDFCKEKLDVLLYKLTAQEIILLLFCISNKDHSIPIILDHIKQKKHITPSYVKAVIEYSPKKKEESKKDDEEELEEETDQKIVFIGKQKK